MKKRLKVIIILALILIPVIWFSITVKNLFFRKLDLKSVNEIEISFMENHNDAEGSITVKLEPEDDNFQRILEACNGYIYVDLHTDRLDEYYEDSCIRIVFSGEDEYIPLYLYYTTFCELRIGKSEEFIDIGDHEETCYLWDLMKDYGMPVRDAFCAIEKMELSYISNFDKEEESDSIVLMKEDADFKRILSVLQECYTEDDYDVAKEVDVKNNLPCIRIMLTRGKKSWSLYLYYDEVYRLQKDNSHIFYLHQADENSTAVMDILEECGMPRLNK